jgi:PAS domain S-box-containing protein
MAAYESVTNQDAVRFFELSPDLCCILGPDGALVSANPAAENILGYSTRELRQISVAELVHPDDRTAFGGVLQDRLSPTRELESRFRTAAGSYRWLLWHASLAGDRVFVTAHDITEAKCRQEKRYWRLFENSKDAIVLLDARTGEILDFNRRTVEMLGYGNELRGKKVWETPPVRPGSIGKRLFDTLQHSETFRCEQELATKTGTMIPCELLCNTYQESGSLLIQVNIRDISLRRRAEAALRESEERFRVLVEGVKEYAIFMIDNHGTVASWNGGAERILGYSESEIIGKSWEILYTPEDREKDEPARGLDTAVREGRAEDERWHVRADGTRFFASGVLTPLWRPRGELRGFAEVMRDITKRKTHEEALREAQKLESIGLLAGGIAHDFNNLLTGIIGSASLAAQDLPPAHPTLRLIEDIITAGMRAADLTRQLLAYSGKGRFTLESFSISDVVAEILELIHASIPAQVRLELRLEKNLPTVDADPTQIQQVAMNLVMNAAEAIEGEGAIRISTGRVRLGTEDLSGTPGLTHLSPGEYVFLQVEDTGVGMREEMKSRIFDPFFTTKFAGRGLGLAAVAGIVRSHRGGIHVLTAPQQGTTFRVFLPATGHPAEQPAGDTASTSRGPATILVADDDAMVRRISQEALERRGYRVLAAGNGKDAVNIFRETTGGIDLVVLDLAMPVMGGEEAHRQIKAIRPEVPVLISSGYSELMASSKFGDNGMEAFIQKPYTATQFADKVQKMLAGAAK